QDFAYRLSHFHKRLDAQKVNYANHLYEIEGKVAKKDNQMVFDLQTVIKNKTIRYTTDESSPSLTSAAYTNVIPMKSSTILKAAVFDDQKKLGRDFTLTFNKHKAVGSHITLNPKPHKAYAGSGKEGLINGISGSDTRYGDKEWLGFWGDNVTITLEFDYPKKISSISTRFYNANGQWIYAPKEMRINYINKDTGNNESQVMNVHKNDATIVPYTINFKETTIQKLEITIPSYGIIPEGKQGAGNKAWTFLDEIVVR
ncbi:MAG: chitobiase/beta-hexosaminidase C-terminal domain-containing protein, partial [Bacteroidota bacterium]